MKQQLLKQKSRYKQSSIKNMKFITSENLYSRFIDKNSILVKIHDKIDFSFVNELCEDLYSDDGQHAYLPELVFRVTFIQTLKGGLSDNEIIKQCKTNLEYRYFCNLAVDDELFDDCKLSRFRKDLGAAKFKQLFDIIVGNIKEAKLISDDEQKKRFVFLVKKAQEIFALTKNMEQSPELKKAVELLRRIVKERAEITGNNEIRKKSADEEKDKIVNISDPDARMMGKSEYRIAPSYKSHVTMNENGYITSTDVTLATIYDGHHAFNMLHELKKNGFQVLDAVGDTHYGDIQLRKDMSNENTRIIAPYRKSQIMNSCLTNDIMIEAWAYNHTEEYKHHRKIRAHIEPKQGEMKNLHSMKRARFRGLEKVKIQNYMSALVTNCKKFAAS